MTDCSDNGVLRVMDNGLKAAIAAIKEADERGDFPKACRLGDEYVAQYPESAEILALYSHLLLWRGRHDEAVAAMEKACALGPNVGLAWAAKVEILTFDGALEDAKTDAERAMEFGGNDPWVIERCKDAYSLGQDYEKALALARHWCEICPDDDLPLSSYIGTLSLAGKNTEADEVLAEAEKRFPESPLIWHKRARVFMREHRQAEGLDQISRAAKRMDGSFMLWGEYAVFLCALGKLEEAEAAAQHSLAISAVSVLSMNTMSNICRKRGQNKDAIEWDRKAKAAIPAMAANACLREANAALRTGKFSSVIRIIDACVDQMVPVTRGVALEIKTRALLELKMYKQAEAVITEFKNTGRVSATVPFLHGKLLAAQKKHSEAIEELCLGLVQYPRDGELRAGLLRSLHATKRTEEKQALINDTWSNLPQVAWGFGEIVMAMDDTGHKHEACKLLTIGLERFPDDEMLLTLLAGDLIEAGDISGAMRVAGNFKGDMRNVSAMVNGAKSFFRWAPVILWMAAIFYLSSQPKLPSVPLLSGIEWGDKVAHAIAYAVGGALVWRALSRKWPKWWQIAATVALTTAFGLSDEFHQLYVPPRTFDMLDLSADVIGSALAAMTLTFAVGNKKDS